MHKQSIIGLILVSLFVCSCGQSSAPLPTDTPTPTEIPTEEPTPEPQPTATAERVESGFYARQDGIWQIVYEDEMTGPVILPEELTGGSLAEMQQVQYGYFANYDAETNVLTAYTSVLLGGLYRMISFQLADDQTVVCLPETVGDDVAIDTIKFMPTNGKVGFPPGPGHKRINELLLVMHEGVYTVFVLETSINAAAINPLNQLAMVCP